MVLFKSIFINYNYRLFRDLSVQKSVHSRYNIRGIRKISLKRKSPKTNCFKAFLRAGERIRTADRLITNQLLYQLSYTSIFEMQNYYFLTSQTRLQILISGSFIKYTHFFNPKQFTRTASGISTF